MGTDSVRKGSFIATDRRILFYAKKMGGYDLESFPYDVARRRCLRELETLG